MSTRAVGMAVIGAGYWGPNLVRNISLSPVAELKWVCDLDVARAARTIGRRTDVGITADVHDVLADPAVDAVAIATPSGTHLGLGLAALQAGKHVLIEKPLAASVQEGEQLVEEARDRDLVLMCDHTFCYTPVVRRLRELLHSGELGDLHYIDSTRVNLGLVHWDERRVTTGGICEGESAPPDVQPAQLEQRQKVKHRAKRHRRVPKRLILESGSSNGSSQH